MEESKEPGYKDKRDSYLLVRVTRGEGDERITTISVPHAEAIVLSRAVMESGEWRFTRFMMRLSKRLKRDGTTTWSHQLREAAAKELGIRLPNPNFQSR